MHITSSSESSSESNDVHPIRKKQQPPSTRSRIATQKGKEKEICLLKSDTLAELLRSFEGLKPKLSRRQLRERFGKYDQHDTGVMIPQDFKKCLQKTGMHMKKDTALTNIVDCFTDGANNGVDYDLFLEFACNVRWSENMSSIAENLRVRICRSPDKSSAMSKKKFSLLQELSKLDKLKRGWISDEHFKDFLEKGGQTSGARFHIDQSDVKLLLKRFAFQFGRHQYAIDYELFASWVQPSQHFDLDSLNDKFHRLLRMGIAKRGWDIESMFEFIDEDQCGHISDKELEKLISDIGLPLSEAQVHCIIKVYDKNHDGKIFYKKILRRLSDKRVPLNSRRNLQVNLTHISPDYSDPNASADNKSTIRDKFSSHFEKLSARKKVQSNGKKCSVGNRKENIGGVEGSKQSEEKHHHRKEKFFGKKTFIKSSRRIESTFSEQSSQEESKMEVTSGKHRCALGNLKQNRKPESSDSSDRSTMTSPRMIVNRNLTDTSSADTSSDDDTSKNASSDRGRMKETSSEKEDAKERQDSKVLKGKTKNQSNQRSKVEKRVDTKNQPERNRKRGWMRIPPAKITKSSNAEIPASDLQQNKVSRKKKSCPQSVHRIDKLAKPLKHVLRRAFEFFDIDRSGAIEVQELELVLQALEYELTPSDVANEMKHSDLDHNGRLDFQEFSAFIKRIMQRKQFFLTNLREHEIRRALQSLDRDKNGYLDRQEFVYMTDQILQVQLTPKQQTSLFDFIDVNGDGMIQEEEFISFLTLYHQLQVNRLASKSKMPKFSPTITDAIKKLIHGYPVDVDGNLLMLLGIPSNFRRAVSSFVSSGKLEQNSMEYVLSFPAPQVVTSLTQLTTVSTSDRSRSSSHNPIEAATDFAAIMYNDTSATKSEETILNKAEKNQFQAILSLKRATGIPKPFDSRENDVVKRCVNVCMFQEEKRNHSKNARDRRHHPITGKKNCFRAGRIVGNVLEIPVSWNPNEEDVWEFSKRATSKQDYKFLARTNMVSDELFLLIEFIVHLKLPKVEAKSLKLDKDLQKTRETRNPSDIGSAGSRRVVEMVCCWTKIPLYLLLERRTSTFRTREKLLGGTVFIPCEVEKDEIMRRRYGWRAFSNVLRAPRPPTPMVGIKCSPIKQLSDEYQKFVYQMPPLLLLPYSAISITAEYMMYMHSLLSDTSIASSVVACAPALKILPRIIESNLALTSFCRAFESETKGCEATQDRQRKLEDICFRFWPLFMNCRGELPKYAVSLHGLHGGRHIAKDGQSQISDSGFDINQVKKEPQLLEMAIQGNLQMQDADITTVPFHIKEMIFKRIV
uniref:Uncharacterized protein AlNc14C4G597 n=1 Tax=Albugo laibachii Nc14 TaxID=890382 RepID=F0W0F4_9STRA|nr:conserved hypothetical protein [Albugo laibachii Nc14]|eukprot:CCA14526.1 conserved hypothetical protein [Albugo laibachii Nc14]